MIALLVSPDYASHYLPMSAVGAELRARGVDVVVASGPGLAPRVEADGFGHRLLPLGPGSNPGLIRVEEQSPEEAARLRAFFDATGRGAAATLLHQAEQRLDDLLWQPEFVTERLATVLDEVQPDIVLTDQIAFGASLALRALERPYASLLVGHPTQLPAAGELFGLPPTFPPEIEVNGDELAVLRVVCTRAAARFADEYRTSLRRLNPTATAPADPFAAGSPWLTLINYPGELTRRRRGDGHYLGACVRHEQVEPALLAEIERLPPPRVYVSLGSFLSLRSDVLARIAAAFRHEPVSVVVASGTADPELLGPQSDRMLVRPYVAQAGLLPHFDLVVCHGGNNTVTEALSAGLPLMIAPFSSDQFAGAADIRAAGLGGVFDPNRTSPLEIARLADRILAGDAPRRAGALGRTLRARPGPVAAAGRLIALARAQRGHRPLATSLRVNGKEDRHGPLQHVDRVEAAAG